MIDLQGILRTILERHQDVVPIDAIGDAIGAQAIDIDQIDRLLQEIEAAGRTISAPSGGSGVATLKTVIPTARALTTELKRTPKISEIAERAKLGETEVRNALLLAKVMQRR
ncbi:MAG: sigma-70 domain-containing protein [Polyangiales bacterium]